MKTEVTPVTLTKKMVEEFEAIIGPQHKLPPTFPMIFYRYIEIPWTSSTPPVLRKQYGTMTKELVVGETYRCQVVLEKERKKRDHTFYTQCLYVYDQNEEVCTNCVSVLVTNSPLQKKQ